MSATEQKTEHVVKANRIWWVPDPFSFEDVASAHWVPFPSYFYSNISQEERKIFCLYLQDRHRKGMRAGGWGIPWIACMIWIFQHVRYRDGGWFYPTHWREVSAFDFSNNHVRLILEHTFKQGSRLDVLLEEAKQWASNLGISLLEVREAIGTIEMALCSPHPEIRQYAEGLLGRSSSTES